MFTRHGNGFNIQFAIMGFLGLAWQVLALTKSWYTNDDGALVALVCDNGADSPIGCTPLINAIFEFCGPLNRSDVRPNSAEQIACCSYDSDWHYDENNCTYSPKTNFMTQIYQALDMGNLTATETYANCTSMFLDYACGDCGSGIIPPDSNLMATPQDNSAIDPSVGWLTLPKLILFSFVLLSCIFAAITLTNYLFPRQKPSNPVNTLGEDLRKGTTPAHDPEATRLNH